ncbi:MAG: Gfo/Idh/MocA family oxidoreductase [Candidatus Latescibacterota bacterium]|nr:Gfo/Idh/MocA family oxidoreductase [Candidatus Latescibacterota bacterium]
MSDCVYRAGAIGRTGRGNFGHGLHKCYSGVPNVELVAIADDDDEGRANALEESGAHRSYADYYEMLEKENLSIVSVCPRWVDCHEEMITAALESGCHVYVEKPMTATLESADRILNLADSMGLKIAVAHQAAYLPQVHAVKEMIDRGRIGKILSIRATGKMDHRGGGEDMLVLGTHLFNLMRMFAGDISSVWGRVSVGGRDIEPTDVREASEPIGWIAGNAVHGFFIFKNGTTGTFDSRRRENRDGRPYGMEIIGEDGVIAFNERASKVTLLEEDTQSPWEIEQVKSAVELDALDLVAGNTLAIVDLVKAIEEDREPIASGRGARAALEMIMGVYVSQLTGKRICFPLADRSHPLAAFRQSL